VQDSKPYAHSHSTQPFPDSPVKDLPWREQVSAEGGLLEAATAGDQRSRPRPADARPPGGSLCRTSREESGARRSGR